MEQISFSIRGMTCAACAKRVEKAIAKLEGVTEVNVNFATEKAFVTYDQHKVRVSEMKEAVVKAGYQPLEVRETEAEDEDRARKEKEIKTLWRKFLVAAIFAFPLLYIAMVPMIKVISLPGAQMLDSLMMPPFTPFSTKYFVSA